MLLKVTPAYITVTEVLCIALQDWQYIIQHIKWTPTLILYLLPTVPPFISYSDAHKLGYGGVWSPAAASIPYTVW